MKAKVTEKGVVIPKEFLEGIEDDDEDAARVRSHIRDDIRYVVVDEYQDVNPLQERLVREMSQLDKHYRERAAAEAARREEVCGRRA